MIAATGKRSAWNAVAVSVNVSIRVNVSSLGAPGILSGSTGTSGSSSPVLGSIFAFDRVLP
jgi:hypothetical protein